MLKSILAVALGVLLALAVGALVVFGILAPVFTSFLSNELARTATFPVIFLIFAAAFSFYFGGMLAGYRAPGRRRLHGTLVAPAAFVLSSAINLATGNGVLPEDLDTSFEAALAAVFLMVSVAASYVGSRRGEALYAYNQRHIRRQRARKRQQEEQAGSGKASNSN